MAYDFNAKDKSLERENERQEFTAIYIKQLFSAFVMIAFGIFAAILVFVSELFYNRNEDFL